MKKSLKKKNIRAIHFDMRILADLKNSYACDCIVIHKTKTTISTFYLVVVELLKYNRETKAKDYLIQKNGKGKKIEIKSHH